ncbi:hypothetical protein EDC01DRAFT_782882 [Geopyxis carbonaria]|nr:hypothetical protein EDC01DRAFT_782882 [Geopyxis carbonaria]
MPASCGASSLWWNCVVLLLVTLTTTANAQSQGPNMAKVAMGAGATVGGVAFVVGLAGLIYYLRRRHKRKQPPPPDIKAELGGDSNMITADPGIEAVPQPTWAEAAGSEAAAEADGRAVGYTHEMPSNIEDAAVMADSRAVYVELPAEEVKRPPSEKTPSSSPRPSSWNEKDDQNLPTLPTSLPPVSPPAAPPVAPPAPPKLPPLVHTGAPSLPPLPNLSPLKTPELPPSPSSSWTPPVPPKDVHMRSSPQVWIPPPPPPPPKLPQELEDDSDRETEKEASISEKSGADDGRNG